MESLTHTLTALFYSVPETMRYVVIFLSSFIEGVPVIGSLFPGGTVALLIGSLSEGGFVNPLGAVAVIAIGTFAGDMIGFVAGRYFRHHRWLKTFIESEKHKKGWGYFRQTPRDRRYFWKTDSCGSFNSFNLCRSAWSTIPTIRTL
jgi:membrane protein DedA with SNARE-associated domain